MAVGRLLSLVRRRGTHCQNVYVTPLLLVLLFLTVFSKHSFSRSISVSSALEALATMRYINPRFTLHYITSRDGQRSVAGLVQSETERTSLRSAVAFPFVCVMRLTYLPSREEGEESGWRTKAHTPVEKSWLRAFGLCCHSNETCTPIADPPNSAQLEGTPYHSANLRPGPCSSVGMRRWTDRHRHTQTRVTNRPIHFASSTTHAKCKSV